MKTYLKRASAIVLISLTLGGCGTVVPPVEEVWEGQDALKFELNVKRHIYCELQLAVERVSGGYDTAVKFDNADALPDDWGVQVALSFQIDENAELDPGISLIRPLSAMTSYTTALGGKLSSQAERVDKYVFYYPVGPLKKSLVGSGNTDCAVSSNSSPLSNGNDLKIFEWLRAALFVERVDPSAPIPSAAGGTFKPDVLSYETKFIVTTSANATPQLKLVRVSVNNTTPFASAGRMRTHDLTLTFGPTQTPGKPGTVAKKGGPREPSTIAANSALASDISSSIASKLAATLGN